MPYEKGQSGNPNGRPKGAKGKASGALRESIREFLEGNFERVQRDFDDLEPKVRVKLWIELLQYALPKLRIVDLAEAEDEERIYQSNGINPVTGFKE